MGLPFTRSVLTGISPKRPSAKGPAETFTGLPGTKAISRTPAAKRLDAARLGRTAVGCRASARIRQTVPDDSHIPRIGRLAPKSRSQKLQELRLGPGPSWDYFAPTRKTGRAGSGGYVALGG